MNNPKLQPGRSNWYRYYAGYSLEFARHVAESADLEKGAHALDPWSGSGTTVVAFAELGITCTGFDANPALVVVARGRLLPSSVRQSLIPIAHGILEVVEACDYSDASDPLTMWFVPSTARRIRRLEWAIQHLLVSHDDYAPIAAGDRLTQLSNLAAFYYVVLFEVVRDLVRKFRSTNPTWMTRPTPEGRLGLSWPELTKRFLATVATLQLGLAKPSVGNSRARIQVSTSTKMPLADASIDVILGSPPYLTRIDYVIATLPELAVLGLSTDAIRRLRDTMIGTPTIHTSSEDSVPERWSGRLRDTLNAIATHPSKASSTYYVRHYQQYFLGMAASFSELRRVIKENGRVFLVVQDSQYKELHVDLASLITDLATSVGFTELDRSDFEGRRTWRRLNPRAIRYGPARRPVESVITFGLAGAN